MKRPSARRARPLRRAPGRTPTVAARLDRLIEKVERLEHRIESLQPLALQRAPASALIEEAMALEERPEAPLLGHVRGNARAREALIREFGLLSSAQVAELAGSAATNRAALAHRWKAAGQIFSVTDRGEERFPAFQFDARTARPRQAIAEIAALLAPLYAGWSLALWFLGSNAFLEGGRLVDALERAPQRAIDAARAERELLADEFAAAAAAEPAGAARSAASA